MEKEGAEKAITEFDDSVTSKEDKSLAEKNENPNGALAETKATAVPAEPLLANDIEEAEKSKKDASEDALTDSANESKDVKAEPKISEKEEALAEAKKSAEELPTSDDKSSVESKDVKAETKISEKEETLAEDKKSAEGLPTANDKSSVESKDVKAETEISEKGEALAEDKKSAEELPTSDDKSSGESKDVKAEPKISEKEEALAEDKKSVEELPASDEKSSDESKDVTAEAEISEKGEALAEDKKSAEELPTSDEKSSDESKDVKAEPEISEKEQALPEDRKSAEGLPTAEDKSDTEEDPLTDKKPAEVKKSPKKKKLIKDDSKPQTEAISSKTEDGDQVADKTTEKPVQDSDDKVAASDVKAPAKDKQDKKAENAKDDTVVEDVPPAAGPHDEYQNADFTTYSKEELVEVIKKLGKEENPFFADKILKLIAPVFNKIRGQEREEALKNFVKEGGAEDDFQFKPDELSLRFDANYKLIKDKKTKKFKQQDIERGKNLIIAEEVLTELRGFVDSEESSSSFSSFKVIQQKWKDIGDVPSQKSRTLWANYNALLHRFYDQRSIYFELKELDRKKNYEAKLVLCDKAEALVDVENLRVAIKGLNDLHYEFKHFGPVPQDVQEELWQRFKSASDKVYERRKAFVHELKAELHENLTKKEELIEKIKLFIEFQSDRIKEWNEKTKELITLQNTWESIGGLPKEKARQINKEFWSSFKKFFSNKHHFFKKLDADREEHLIKKKEILEQAAALKDSEDWDKTANELKKLQSMWRDIGPVPEKMRKKLYDEFKASCDHFFDKRRLGLKNSQDVYKENLQKKKALIEEINKFKKDADKNLDKFNEVRKAFLELGYVPKKNIGSIKEEYQRAIEDFLNNLTVLNVKEKTEINLEAEFSGLAGSDHSESELYHKEQSVRRQINKLEDDIALWQNNLEFFAHSKSTDKLREEVNKKIDDANVHVDSLKRQLKMLRTL